MSRPSSRGPGTISIVCRSPGAQLVCSGLNTGNNDWCTPGWTALLFLIPLRPPEPGLRGTPGEDRRPPDPAEPVSRPEMQLRSLAGPVRAPQRADAAGGARAELFPPPGCARDCKTAFPSSGNARAESCHPAGTGDGLQARRRRASSIRCTPWGTSTPASAPPPPGMNWRPAVCGNIRMRLRARAVHPGDLGIRCCEPSYIIPPAFHGNGTIRQQQGNPWHIGTE